MLIAIGDRKALSAPRVTTDAAALASGSTRGTKRGYTVSGLPVRIFFFLLDPRPGIVRMDELLGGIETMHGNHRASGRRFAFAITTSAAALIGAAVYAAPATRAPLSTSSTSTTLLDPFTLDSITVTSTSTTPSLSTSTSTTTTKLGTGGTTTTTTTTTTGNNGNGSGTGGTSANPSPNRPPTRNPFRPPVRSPFIP
jgi:hypothetical protein